MGSLKNIDKITTIVLDVDGVLTDGRIGYSGPDEIKFFHVLDGSRITMALRAGLSVGILSGRKSKANETRAAELKLSFMIQGCHNKLEGWNTLLETRGLKPEQCMYIGDDLIDLPPMRRCGLAVAVASACSEVKEAADLVTPLPGGQGGVACAIEFLLKGQNKWSGLLERYYS